MTDFAVWLIATLVFVPWLLVALWSSMRFRQGEDGALAVVMLPLRVAVFAALSLILCTIAGVGMFFWANIAAEAPGWALLAHGIAAAPAYWIAKDVELPFGGTSARVARVVLFLGVAFWAPVFVLVVGALAYEAF